MQGTGSSRTANGTLERADASLAAPRFLDKLKGKKLSSADIDVVWSRYCRGDREVMRLAELMCDTALRGKLLLLLLSDHVHSPGSDMLRDIRLWNFGDPTVPQELIDWWRRGLHMVHDDRVRATRRAMRTSIPCCLATHSRMVWTCTDHKSELRGIPWG